MAYMLMKKVITAGAYDRADMENKLDVYFGFNRITQAQYEELHALMA